MTSAAATRGPGRGGRAASTSRAPRRIIIFLCSPLDKRFFRLYLCFVLQQVRFCVSSSARLILWIRRLRCTAAQKQAKPAKTNLPLFFADVRNKQFFVLSVTSKSRILSFGFLLSVFYFSGGAVPFSDVFTSSEGVMDIWFDRQSTLGFMRWNPEPRTRIKCVVSFKNRYPPPERTILFPRSLPEPTKHGAGGLPVFVPYI